MPGFDPSFGKLRSATFAASLTYHSSITYDAPAAPDDYAYYQMFTGFQADSVYNYEGFVDPYTGEIDRYLIVPFEGEQQDVGAYILRSGTSGTVAFDGHLSQVATARDLSDLYGLSHLSAIYVPIQAYRSNFVEVIGDPGLRVLDSSMSQVGSLSVTYDYAVPEPATWVLMIIGFGMIGGALRRRSAVRTKVSFA